MDIHPLAGLIPPMSADELEKLTADIAHNGLLEPIVTFEGKILDGRHRAQACESAGVVPRYEEFAGSDPVGYVLSKNLHRRHLTSAQKAAIAVEALPLLEQQAKERQGARTDLIDPNFVEKMPQSQSEGKSRDQAAELTGSNPRYVSDAKKIAVDAPEVFAAMKNNEVSMLEAKTLSQKSEPERTQILASLPTMSKPERREVFHPPDPELEEPEEELIEEMDAEEEEDTEEGSEEEMDAPADSDSLSVHFSSETPEWYTPSVVLERVVACLGPIDLDPCANPARTVPAARHFTESDDGLSQPWMGRVFMNPPYGREIDAWVAKLVDEFAAGRVIQAIALVPARTDTAWFRRLHAFPVAFWRGRITFVGPGWSENPAPFPSALAALGVNPDQFATAFADVADVYVPLVAKE